MRSQLLASVSHTALSAALASPPPAASGPAPAPAAHPLRAPLVAA